MLYPLSIAFYIVNPNTVLQSVKFIERARYVHSFGEIAIKKIATINFFSSKATKRIAENGKNCPNREHKRCRIVLKFTPEPSISSVRRIP